MYEKIQEERRRNRFLGLDQSAWGQFIAILLLLLATASLFVISTMTETHNPNHVHADYVITGTGPAGSVLAEMLSRDPLNQVYVFEAGFNGTSDEILEFAGPQTATIPTDHFAKYFWQQAQEYAEVIPNRPSLQYTGVRVLGGGSRGSGMQWVRGTDWNYEAWVAATDDELWNVSNVLEAYKEIERYTGFAPDYTRRGSDGRLAVIDAMIQPPQTTPSSIASKFVTAMEQLTGLPRLDDYNLLTPGARVGPFLRYQLTQETGTPSRRMSAEKAFLSPDVLARPNLHVITEATVVKVLIDKNKVAYGVRYIKEGEEHEAYARKRVILSAGINTPIILQHSGIGNASYLQSVGITPVYDNPNVGRFYNHQGLFSFMLKNSSDTASANPGDLYEGGAWLPNPTPNATEYASPRRIQFINIDAGPVLFMVIIDVQTQKEGYVRVRSADPLRGPISSDNIFVPPEGDIDKTTYINTVKEYICKLRDEYQGFGVGPAVDTSYELVSPPYSICSDDAAIAEFVRTNVLSQGYHWSSSARMGKLGDGISVTNSRGSVWGIEQLTVADDSVIPRLNDGNTQATSYLVGHVIGKEILAGRH